MTNNTNGKTKPFLAIEFRDIDKKIHIDTYMSQKDEDGWMMRIYQRDGVIQLLEQFIKTLKDPLENHK